MKNLIIQSTATEAPQNEFLDVTYGTAKLLSSTRVNAVSPPTKPSLANGLLAGVLRSSSSLSSFLVSCHARRIELIVNFRSAILVAVAHYLYYSHLDRVPTGFPQSVPQSLNNAISTAFAHLFSSALVGSATLAFTQLLRWQLRRKALKGSTVDALFSLTSSYIKLSNMDVLISTPVLWFFALLFPCIPFATIFPPGALVVQPLAINSTNPMHIPTLDVDFPGNGSAVDFFKYAMFSAGTDGEYR